MQPSLIFCGSTEPREPKPRPAAARCRSLRRLRLAITSLKQMVPHENVDKAHTRTAQRFPGAEVSRVGAWRGWRRGKSRTGRLIRPCSSRSFVPRWQPLGRTPRADFAEPAAFVIFVCPPDSPRPMPLRLPPMPVRSMPDCSCPLPVWRAPGGRGCHAALSFP